jgi:hypothetical protein
MLIPFADVNFNQELQALWVDLSAHIEDTETNDLVTLEDQLSTVESESLSHSFCQAKMLAAAGEHPQHDGIVHPADLLREFLSVSGDSAAALDSTSGADSAAPWTQRPQKTQ